MHDVSKPFDGAISRFFEDEAPKSIRRAIEDAGKDDILNPEHPYQSEMDGKAYDRAMDALQIELVRLQSWVRDSGARVAIVFEGRDAAGKGGTIKRVRENLNPRVARVVALSKPSDRERGQWYFQRYIAHLPSAGEIVCFDRSWYNRAVVEHVFGFCSDQARETFFQQVTAFEQMLAQDGIYLIKLWLNVGQAEQLRRFLKREGDPLKQWKLSRIDVDGLAKWDAYTQAIAETFARTHLPTSPWHVIRTDDKKRARLAAIQTILAQVPYGGQPGAPDPGIAGDPVGFGLV